MKPLTFNDMADIYRINHSVNPQNVCIFELSNGNYAFLGENVNQNPDSSPVVKKPYIYNGRRLWRKFSEFPRKRLEDRVRNTLKSTWGTVEVFDRYGRSAVHSHIDKLSAAVPPVEELAKSIGDDDFLTAFKGGDYVTYFGEVAANFGKETGAKVSFIPVPEGVGIDPDYLNEKHELPAYSMPVSAFGNAIGRIDTYDLCEFSEISVYKVNSNAGKKERFEYTSDYVYEGLSDVQKRLLDEFDFKKVSISDFLKCIGLEKPVREDYHYIYDSPFDRSGELRVYKSDDRFIWEPEQDGNKGSLNTTILGFARDDSIYGDLFKLASLVSGEGNVTRLKAYISGLVNEKLDVSLYLKDRPARKEKSKTIQNNNSMAGLKNAEISDAYARMKEKHPDAVLMFRNNGGYSIIKDDAEKVKDVIDAKLSFKVLPDKSRIPAVNFPKEDLDSVLPKIVRSGLRVAILDGPVQKMEIRNGSDNILDIPKQFSNLKSSNEDHTVLMRVGDFYHAYGKDAEDISKAAGTTLTGVKTADGNPLAQTMFPYRELDNIQSKILDIGRPVAIAVPRPENPNEYGIVERVSRSEDVKTTVEKKQENADVAEGKEKEQKHRAPQMMTPDGEAVTHGHVFASTKNPEDNFFVAKINGVPLKPQLIMHEEAIAFIKGEISVPEMMQKYYPSKLMSKVPEEAFNLPVTIEGERTVHKFNVYKETDQQSSDYGKYKFFARVDDRNMSTLASKADLGAYFDRTMSPAQLVEKNFGERLGLKSYYDRFKLPEGAGIDSKDIKIFKSGSGKEYLVQVDLGDAGKTPAKVISGSDRWSLWHTKSATREQIAAKYCNDSISDLLKGGKSEKLERKSALKV